MKEGDDSREIEKLGWLSAVEGMNLAIYEIRIITDSSSTFNIPLIYVEGVGTSLELESSSIHVPTLQLINIKVDSVQLSDFALIEMKYTGEVITFENVLNVENCEFSSVVSTISSSSLIEIEGEDTNKIPIGAASVLKVQCANAILFPIRFVDTQIIDCTCSLNVPSTEIR